MSIKHKIYTDEFKQEAVKLALNTDRSIDQTARDLGIPSATLHGWLAKARRGTLAIVNDAASNSKLSLSELVEENKRLRKDLARLEQEKAILKKATAYFAKELG